MIFILALLAVLPYGLGEAQTADFIVENARIYTSDAAHPNARALAVKDGKLIAVGDGVSSFIGPHTQRIDAHGGVIVPGLIDSHGHMLGLGTQIETFDLRQEKSIAAIA